MIRICRSVCLIAVLAVVPAAWRGVAAAEPAAVSGRAATEPAEVSVGTATAGTLFDYAGLDRILRATVRGGRVDYARLKADYAGDLSRVLDTMARADPESFVDDDERFAFYLNAYNALVLRFIVDHYPVSGPFEIGQEKFFDQLKAKVAGRRVSLNQLEKGIIHQRFGDPRSHFVLVCAAMGCPELPDRAIRGEDLDQTLDERTRRFVTDPGQVRYEAESNTLHLSQLFNWYAADFEKEAGSVKAFLKRYLPGDQADSIDGAQVVYREYSWALNVAEKPTRDRRP